jgi:serine phosphatase RsbU (regulator of sigma subunit)
LNLLQPLDSPQPASQPAARQPVMTRGGQLGPAQHERRGEFVSKLMERGPVHNFSGQFWNSLRDKASLLFVVDTVDDMRIVRVVGAAPDADKPEDAVRAARQWLTTLDREELSPYLTLKRGGAHLVGMPVRNSRALIMVAVVPVASLERDVLDFVNRSPSTGAMLVDENGTFLSSSRPGAVGKNVSEFNDPRMRELAEKYLRTKTGGSETFDRAEMLGDVKFSPAMSTIAPVEVFGKKWFVVVSSSLDDVDNVVKPIFRNAILWAAAVMLATMLILASTSIQLIRSRVRLERMEREVMAREINDARKIQLQWLPKGACSAREVQIAAINLPATHISGDFYNWFVLEDGRVVVTIGDVTGHGMAAAFLMATTQLLVRNIMPRVLDPGSCLEEVNRQLCMQTFSGQFVTLLIAVLDPKHCRMDLATAGHPAPLVGNGDAFEELPLEPQLVLGVDGEAPFATERVGLAPGSNLLLYTDGLVDAFSPAGDRFTMEGLSGSLFGRFESADAIIRSVRAAVDAHRAGRDLVDDLTLVAIQLQPVPSAVEAAVAT